MQIYYNIIMIIAPETEIYLLKAPLEADEMHQLDFVNETAQVNYFQSLPKLALMNATYQRENGVMYVGFNIEQIRTYNYVMYKNKQYSNKWFYAFITGLEYEGNSTTGVSIKTDVFQTYLFEYQWKRSYIKRETVSDDTFGKHLIKEDFDTGDFIVNHSKTHFVEVASTKYTALAPNRPLMCVQCTEKVGVLYESSSAGANTVEDTYIMGSLPQGAYYYFFDTLPLGETGAGYDCFKQFRNHLDSIGKGSAIMNIFLVPRRSIYEAVPRYIKMYKEDGTESSSGIFLYEPSANTYGANVITSVPYNKPTTIDGYTPKNNKLFTSQFNYFVVSNFAGSIAEYHWEDFKTIGSTTLSTPNFEIKGVLSASTSYIIQPTNSIKSDISETGGETGKISTEIMSGAIMPTLSWESDYYLNWLAQNNGKFDLQKRNVIADAVGDSLSSAVSTTLASGGNWQLGLIAGGASAINGFVNYQNLVDQIDEEKRVADIVPNSVKGNTGVGDISFAMNSVGFAFYNFQIRNDMAVKADRYFDMFGYRVNELKTPNTKTRRYWNFIQTVGANIVGEVPQEAVAELKAMFNAGLTIWHDPSNFLNYDLTNSIL